MTLWDTVWHRNTLWDSVWHCQIPWDILRYCEALWDTQRPNETLWDTLKPSETLWDTVRYCEILWDSVRPYETLRSYLRHFKSYGTHWDTESLWYALRHYETLKYTVLGASVILRQLCLFFIKHCLAFSCKQPTIPYRNRNWTKFLYLFILVNSTEINNNDYNTVSLVVPLGGTLSYSVCNLNW